MPVFARATRVGRGLGKIDININMNIVFGVKTISMVDLRTHSERIVRDLKRGERMMLSYRGEPLAELVPAGAVALRVTPLEALHRARTLTTQNPTFASQAADYIRVLAEDRKAWGERGA